jgi:hypothetical protein
LRISPEGFFCPEFFKNQPKYQNLRAHMPR